MKPFKINRDSWHYELNKNFFNESSMKYDWEPKHNNFCDYWRATMFRVLFAALLISVVGFMLIILGVGVYRYPLESAFIVGGTLGVCATLFGFFVIGEFLINRKNVNANKPDSLFMQKYKAHKSKICPMVEYD